MRHDHWEIGDDFFGAGSYTTSPNDNPLLAIKDTSASGSPTHELVDGSAAGELAIDLAATNEAEVVTLYQGDTLQVDVDKVREVRFRVKLNQASLAANSSLAFGVAGDQDDALDDVAQHAWFRLSGSGAITVETDDGVHDNDDVATGAVLTNAYQEFVISFATGKHDVRFFVDGQPVATGTTFDLSGYTGSLQLFLQLQKASGTQTDGVTVDYVSARGIR